jgi:ATP-dependent Zn protease
MSLLIAGGLLYWCSQLSVQEQQKWLDEWEIENLIPPYDRRADAAHEAAHAIVGAVVGLSVDYVSLERVIREDGVQNGCTLFSVPVSADKRSLATAIVAGGLGERLVFSEVRPSLDRDKAQLKELFPDVCPEDMARIVRNAERVALRIIEENGAALIELADMLVSRTRVSGAVIRGIVEKHCPREQAA